MIGQKKKKSFFVSSYLLCVFVKLDGRLMCHLAALKRGKKAKLVMFLVVSLVIFPPLRLPAPYLTGL